MKKLAVVTILMLALVCASELMASNPGSVIINGHEIQGPLNAAIGGCGLILTTVILACVGIFLAFVFTGVGLVVLSVLALIGLILIAVVLPFILPFLIFLIPLFIVLAVCTRRTKPLKNNCLQTNQGQPTQ